MLFQWEQTTRDDGAGWHGSGPLALDTGELTFSLIVSGENWIIYGFDFNHFQMFFNFEDVHVLGKDAKFLLMCQFITLLIDLQDDENIVLELSEEVSHLPVKIVYIYI